MSTYHAPRIGDFVTIEHLEHELLTLEVEPGQRLALTIDEDGCFTGGMHLDGDLVPLPTGQMWVTAEWRVVTNRPTIAVDYYSTKV